MLRVFDNAAPWTRNLLGVHSFEEYRSYLYAILIEVAENSSADVYKGYAQ